MRLPASLRQQAAGVEALLAVLEWGDIQKAATSRGTAPQTLSNHLSNLYSLLGVRDRVNATLMLWPLIKDQVVLRDRAGDILMGRREEDRAA